MASRIAKYFHKKVGGPVDHLGGVRESGNTIDIPIHGHDVFNGVERTEMPLQNRELCQGTSAGGSVALFDGAGKSIPSSRMRASGAVVMRFDSSWRIDRDTLTQQVMAARFPAAVRLKFP